MSLYSFIVRYYSHSPFDSSHSLFIYLSILSSVIQFVNINFDCCFLTSRRAPMVPSTIPASKSTRALHRCPSTSKRPFPSHVQRRNSIHRVSSMWPWLTSRRRTVLGFWSVRSTSPVWTPIKIFLRRWSKPRRRRESRTEHPSYASELSPPIRTSSGTSFNCLTFLYVLMNPLINCLINL